ncbi:origin recognition complex subunit 4, partial [Tremellales sp. Uapishka_1]
MTRPISRSPDPLDVIEAEQQPRTPVKVTVNPPKQALTARKGPIPVVEIIKKRRDPDIATPLLTRSSRKSVSNDDGLGSNTPPGAGRSVPPKGLPTARARASATKPAFSSSTAKTTPATALRSTTTPTTMSPAKRTLSTTPSRTSNRTPKEKQTPTLGSSLSKRPSSNKRPRLSLPLHDDSHPLPSLDISRETFLANEALKRQREARNFNFEGDASAPKLTRSGRIVGVRPTDDIDVDEYGQYADEENPFNPQPLPPAEIQREEPQSTPRPTPVTSLPPAARIHILNILSTLTSRDIAVHPPPFIEEEKNEGLQGLVNLLRGTVERGEGNSALVVGSRGVGKTRTVARALDLLPSTSKTSPIIVRLSGLVQTTDRLAIREMGRQIAEAEGKKTELEEEEDEGAEDEEYAPTTLPSHLLALLTTPSARAVIIIIEEFDLFTEHARQALLYCLLDVVQSVKTGPVSSTGRGIAVIGVTSRTDTLLLLEKRVKSRFSHRVWRVISPLSPDSLGWKWVLQRALVPWEQDAEGSKEDRAVQKWKGDWVFAVDMLLDHERIVRAFDRLAGLSTDVRSVYRPFIVPIMEILANQLDFLSIPKVLDSILDQVEGAGWGIQSSKLKGLPHPALGILIIAKHLYYAGREEFNFAQVEEEYLRFSRTKLVGSGRTRWPIGVLRSAFELLLRMALLTTTSHANATPRFAKVRCTLSPHEIVGYFKGEGGGVLGPELGNWGRMMGGHA